MGNLIEMDSLGSFFLESSLRGYHAYKKVEVNVGDVLHCKKEPKNTHDKYAVKIVTADGNTVGHVPVELSEIFCLFLKKKGRSNWVQIQFG